MTNFAQQSDCAMDAKKSRIQILAMDVDGTLTDGKIYTTSGGECFKAFSVKDGYGIKNILPQHSIRPVIITGRSSEIVRRRADELGITEVFQAVSNKAMCLQSICKKYSITFQEIAYIGDDLNDSACMELCGIKGCPADAMACIKQISDFICVRNGGDGAVREFIDWLVEG